MEQTVPSRPAHYPVVGESGRRVCVLTCVTGDYGWITCVTNPFKVAYCRKWGYDYIYLDYKGSPLGRHPFWDRIEYLKRWLGAYDYMWWLDADAAPVDFGKDVAGMLDDGHDFWISQETKPGEGLYLNTGSFVVRNCPRMERFLEHWGGSEVYEEFRFNGNPEQDALNALYKRDWDGFSGRCAALSQDALNSSGVGCAKRWEPGWFVKHLCCGKDRRTFKDEFWNGLDAGEFSKFGVVK